MESIQASKQGINNSYLFTVIPSKISVALCLLMLCKWSLHAQNQEGWLGKLPEEIRESSGLLLLGDRFLTHNDSGNPPVLYELDTAGLEIVRRVTVAGVGDMDWEALAEDEDYFYLGDIGNNQGIRQDLQILRISKAAYADSDWVVPERIFFSYETQREYVRTPRSDYDAEAMIVGGDSIWIFTKQWQKAGTDVYSIPKVPGEYVAKRIASYPLGGLITDACPMPGGDAILLLGYTPQLQPFVYKITTDMSSETSPPRSKKKLLSIGFAQSEGLAVSPDGFLYISTEAFTNRLVSLPAGVYRLDLAAEMEKGSANEEAETPH